MTQLPYLLLALLYWLWSLPFAWWLSLAITVVHTLDEVASEGGPIWEYLAALTHIHGRILLPGYFAFQLSNAGLAFVGYSGSSACLKVLLIIRVIDFCFTHTFLPEVRSPNPGRASRWLLMIDAWAIATSLC